MTDSRRKIADALESHSRRMPLQALAAQGKSHVRVVSGEEALELIQAIVDDAIERSAGAVAGKERDEIVRKTNEEFRRVSLIQAESQELITRQSHQLAGMAQQLKDALGAARRREQRLLNSRNTIESYDREIERLSAQVKEDAAVIAEMQAALRRREEDVRKLTDALTSAPREAAGVDELRSDLAEMKELLSSPDHSGAEARFRDAMDEALGKIGRRIEAAHSGPLDRPVEATDAVMARIFDEEGAMESNLERLEVKVSTAQDGISKSLERLRRLRQSPQDDEPEAPAAP